ncbi:hypothetical protein NDQ57_03405 [Rossellomorea marisflavi]|uniref:hypothetical protein n=1 Tax=Rossellomorea marisflavi TaxID=189381 RepID=UPI00203F62D6|nr:hypothetical protein [Rossellomorea marisflavi]MCM2603749.1 hypothetical protein [Rossellomorea marisflavi]
MNKQYEGKVLNWIKDHFDMSAIVVEDFNVLPYGKRILDMDGGEMAVFYDFFTGEIKQLFPSDSAY